MGTGTVFVYSDDLMGYNMGQSHPMQPRRLRMTYELLESYGVFDSEIEVVPPPLADPVEVARTHAPEFLEAIEALSNGTRIKNVGRFGFGTGDNPIFSGMYEAALRYTGGTLQAVEAVLAGAPVAVNISGGLHHSHYDRAAGFCILNDCAVGIRRLRQKYARVAYVDIDVHHGDGVQELFYDDPTVLTISLHESGRSLFPGTGFVQESGEGAGEGYSLNLPFAPYTRDEVWLSAWREAALPILKAFQPEAILLQLGTDTHYKDPLAHLCLTAQGWLEAVADVKELGVPIVAVGGGGYNLTTVTRMWALATVFLAGLEVSNTVPLTYAHHAEIPYLTDHVTLKIDAQDEKRVEAFAAQSVVEIKERFFSRYGL
jgi:acetoin utilization protein AcuC